MQALIDRFKQFCCTKTQRSSTSKSLSQVSPKSTARRQPTLKIMDAIPPGEDEASFESHNSN